MSEKIVTIVLALMAGGFGAGFTVPFFKYLAAARKETILGKKEEKVQNTVASQVYIATLEKRIETLETRMDAREERAKMELANKDEVINLLQGQVTKLTIEVAEQKITITNLQEQITRNNK